MYKHFVKRLIDVIVCLLALPFFLIIFCLVAPVIVAEDRGPVFYNAPRLGYKGKIFKMFKFRSMKVDSPDLRNEDGTTFNAENDLRVTKFGKILRKTSLDEIPQILNVLKGEMSLIGPRPDLPDTPSIYRKGDEKKLDVKPGITGYSQAYYRNSSTIEQRFDGDVYYAKNVSLYLDFKIIIQTVKILLLRENVYRN